MCKKSVGLTGTGVFSVGCLSVGYSSIHVNNLQIFFAWFKFPVTFSYKLSVAFLTKMQEVLMWTLLSDRVWTQKVMQSAPCNRSWRPRWRTELQLYSSVNLGARCGRAVKVTLWMFWLQERDPVPILQEVGWAQYPVCMGADNLAFSRIWSPDLPGLKADEKETLFPIFTLNPKIFCVYIYTYIYNVSFNRHSVS